MAAVARRVQAADRLVPRGRRMTGRVRRAPILHRRATREGLFALTGNVPVEPQQTRQERHARGGSRDPRGVAVRLAAHFGGHRPRHPQSVLRVFDLREPPRPAAAARETAAGEAAAKRGRIGAEEHQERSDAGRGAEAEDRNAAGAADRRSETPRRERADPGRVGRARAGHRRGRRWNRDGQRQRRTGRRRAAASPSRRTWSRRCCADRIIPRETLDDWPRGATVFMRLRVDARGNVSECTVDRGTGLPSIDNLLCNLAHDRLRFRPAVDRSGQAVAGWFGYAQPAPR